MSEEGGPGARKKSLRLQEQAEGPPLPWSTPGVSTVREQVLPASRLP